MINMINILISLSETDKRVLIALCFLLIFLFVVAGYIGLLISRIMKHQGKKMDTMMHDIVITRVVTNKKDFIKVARKKNWRYFFKTAWIPLIILVFAFVLLLIAGSVYDFEYNIFDHGQKIINEEGQIYYQGGYGFTTLFFIPDWQSATHTDFFGMFEIITSWPTQMLNEPHFSVDALFSYFFVPIFLVGAIWYLIDLQALLARTIKMYQLSDSIYNKNLENFNLNEENMQQVRANQQAINQARINQVFNAFNNSPNNNLNNLNNNISSLTNLNNNNEIKKDDNVIDNDFKNQ